MVTIGVYTLLVILEVAMLIVVLAGVALFQWRKARRELAATRQALREARAAVKIETVERHVTDSAPQRGYADFLGEQIEQSSLLLGHDPAAGDEASDAAGPGDRQMLAVRHQFLQLELDVQRFADADDPLARRSRVIAGMQALLDGLGPQSPDAPVSSDAAEAAGPAETATRLRSEEQKLRDQIEHLRSVIGNQHGVMRELRQLLEEHGADSDELQEALRKLGDAEAQGVELQRCLEVMEQENARLKQSPGRGAGSNAGPDAEMLRDLVGSQQRTISKLQGMLQTLASDPAKARELEEAIGKIQRANNELHSCVMVLEDENSMLRGRIETLEERLAGLETMDTQAGDAGEPPVVAEALPEQVEVPATALAPPASGQRSDTDALLDELFSGGAGKTA